MTNVAERPRIAVTRILPGDALNRLAVHAEVVCWEQEGPPSAADLRTLARDADGIITMLTDRIDGPFLDELPTIRVVSNMAVGVDNIDVAALTTRHIPVGHTPGVLTEATADLAFALLLASARRIVECDTAVHTGEWTTWLPSGYLGLELAGSTLGVIGTGDIGQAVIRRTHGFGMRILASSRTERTLDGVNYVPLVQLLGESDIVTIHLALTAETRHFIGRAELAMMRPGAILINAARGPLVDQVALYDALVSGHLSGAGLDVFEVEPVPPDEPLLSLTSCVTLPHIGSATVKTRTTMANLAVDNVLAGIRGEPLVRCANPEVYER